MTTTDANGADRHIDSAGTALGGPSGGATTLAIGTPLEFDPDYRSEIHTAEDTIDVETYGGGFNLTRRANAPRLRIGRDKWFNLLWLIPIGFALLVAAVAIGKGLYNMPSVQAFIQHYPGADIPKKAPGVPAWLGWTHFFNLFVMMFIIRSGIQILCDHPRLYFSRNATPGKDEWLRVGPPVPDDELWTANADTVALPPQFGLPGFRHSIGLARWWHLGMDVLWLLNGAVFYVLLFTTGQWRHIVPTSWDVFPNALSVAIQYLSVEHWPADNGWVAYNGLQVLAYFTTVFIAAPAAVITGLGMSPALSQRVHWLSKRLSIQHARSLHFLVLVYFLFFIIVHVTLVFATSALRNLNHMFAARDDDSWMGFWIFAAAMVVTAIAWVWATPFTIKHPRVVQRVGYALVGPFQRVLEHLDPKPGAFTEEDISPHHWRNGRLPETVKYKELEANDFKDWRLRVTA